MVAFSMNIVMSVTVDFVFFNNCIIFIIIDSVTGTNWNKLLNLTFQKRNKQIVQYQQFIIHYRDSSISDVLVSGFLSSSPNSSKIN